MEHITKNVDIKLATLTKLQINYRHKQLDFANFAFGNQVDLPPINNLLVRFPSVRKEKVEIKNSRKRKNIIEMNTFFDNKNHSINTDERDRIIFASPIKNRVTYQKTFFKPSLYYSVECRKSKMRAGSTRSESLDQKIKRQANDLSLMPIQIQQQNQKNEQKKINWLSAELGSNNTNKSIRFSNVFDSNPESILEKRKKERKSLEEALPKNKNIFLERYSPWRNDDLEEELIL